MVDVPCLDHLWDSQKRFIFLGNAWQLHEFHANHSQNFTPYNSQSVVLGTQLTLPKSMGINTIFLFQKV